MYTYGSYQRPSITAASIHANVLVVRGHNLVGAKIRAMYDDQADAEVLPLTGPAADSPGHTATCRAQVCGYQLSLKAYY